MVLTIPFLSSCDDEDPVIPNEEELITTVIYTLVPQGGGETVILNSTDLDGIGPGEPITDVEPLQANTVYIGTIQLLNESESPAEDITEEVEEEADEHQLFFTFASVSSNSEIVSIDYADQDSNGHPVGLTTTFTTTDATSGSLFITLRHEPKKPNDGTTADAGGETDIQVTFNIEIVE